MLQLKRTVKRESAGAIEAARSGRGSDGTREEPGPVREDAKKKNPLAPK